MYYNRRYNKISKYIKSPYYDPYIYSRCIEEELRLKDHGMDPFVINIEDATIDNRNYRTAIWTGEYLQATLMSIPAGGDVGLEIHEDTDQFFRVESGHGVVKMGKSEDNLYFKQDVHEGYAVFIPAKTWHNIINVGNVPLKMYSLYAPPHHPAGTIQETKAVAEAQEHKR